MTEKDDIIAITKLVISYVNSNNHKDLSLNLNIPFVLNKAGKLVKPSECYLDSPYLETGFSCAEHIHNKTALSEIYKDKLSDTELKCFIEILIQNKIFCSFAIVKINDLQGNKEFEKFNTRPRYVERETYSNKQDWVISNLNEYLALKNRNIVLINKIKIGETIKKSNGNEVIEIIMDGKIFNLTFVQKHIIDIRSVLEAEKN